MPEHGRRQAAHGRAQSIRNHGNSGQLQQGNRQRTLGARGYDAQRVDAAVAAPALPRSARKHGDAQKHALLTPPPRPHNPRPYLWLWGLTVLYMCTAIAAQMLIERRENRKRTQCAGSSQVD